MNDASQIAAGKPTQAIGIPQLSVVIPTFKERDNVVTLFRRLEQAQSLPKVPVLAVTANAMPDQLAEYLSKGFDGHLAKPFSRVDLLRCIRDRLPRGLSRTSA